MTNSDYQIHQQLDAQGLMCPEPVMLLHKVMRQLEPHQCVEVLATDPATLRDIPNFCRFLNHRLLLQNSSEQVYIFHIQKLGANT
jgi:tRNA 2-thiouridine synthesizing protein A